MANNLTTGNQAGRAKQTVPILETAISSGNCLSITKIGNPNESFKPSLEINNIDDFVEGEFYLIKMSAAADLSAELATKLNWETVPDPVLTTAYRLSGADQTISVANPSDFALVAGTPATIFFYVELTASDAAFRLGRSNGSSRIWDIQFHDEGGVIQCDAYFADDTTSGIRYSTTHDNPQALNTKYLVVISWDGLNHASLLINNVDKTGGIANTGTFTAFETGGTFKIGEFATFTSNNAEISDLGICKNAQLTTPEATELFNGGVRKDVTTASFYAGKVTAYWPLLSNLTDTKGTHNGTATTPQFI